MASSLLVVIGAFGCQAPQAGLGAMPVTFQLNQVTDVAAVPVTPAARPVGGESASTGPAEETAVAPRPPGVPTGGGGTGSASGGTFEGRVLDHHDQPVAGATVLTAGGPAVVTDAAGRFTLAPAQAAMPTAVHAPGFVTSLVAGGALPDTLHLSRLAPAAGTVEPAEAIVRGVVSWQVPPESGGLVMYRDDQAGYALPVAVNADGRFALRVETRRPGRTRGVVAVLAAGPNGHTRLGVSAPFILDELGDSTVSVPVVTADREVSLAVGARPANLPVLRSGLEIAVPGIQPFWIEGDEATTGRFHVPAAGAMAATVRLAVEATNDAADARSVVTIDPYAPPATPPAFLPVPDVQVDAAARRIAWSGLGGTGVMLQLATAAQANSPHWEGWFEGVAGHAFAADQWPSGGEAIARVVAVDGPQSAARHVASAGQLRLLPFSAWTGGYRLAERLTRFTPGGSGT